MKTPKYYLKTPKHRMADLAREIVKTLPPREKNEATMYIEVFVCCVNVKPKLQYLNALCEWTLKLYKTQEEKDKQQKKNKELYDLFSELILKN
jgi:hypothetical protein